jgi:hypothetical protein
MLEAYWAESSLFYLTVEQFPPSLAAITIYCTSNATQEAYRK